MKPYLLSMLVLIIASCYSNAQKQMPAIYQDTLYTIDHSLGADTSMTALLKPFRNLEKKIMSDTVGYSDAPLSKASPECTLGNLTADAIFEAAKKADNNVAISIANQGGIRLKYISPGPITKEQVYQLMPFDNKLIIVEIPGSKIQQLCDHIASYGGWPVSGITFQIKNKQAISILINGKEINPQFVYKTAMPDYIANGGDNVDFLENCKKIPYNIFIRDAILDYISERNKQGTHLNIELQNRITYANE